MQSEIKEFQAKIYLFKGRTLMCPHSPLKIGMAVIGTPDGENVDPLKKYRFVIDVDGEVQSVSANKLKLLKKINVKWERKPLTTHTQEVQARQKAAIEIFKNWIQDKIHT